MAKNPEKKGLGKGGMMPPKHTQYGQPGAPKPGCPPGTRHIPKLIRNEILRQARDDPKRIPALVRNMFDIGESIEHKSSVAAFKELADRIDGPTVKRVEAEVTERRQTVEIHEEQDDAEGER